MSSSLDAARETALLDMDISANTVTSQTESSEPSPTNGSRRKPATISSILGGYRQELVQLTEMADRMSGQIEEIRETAREANNRLKQLEIDLALLETEES